MKKLIDEYKSSGTKDAMGFLYNYFGSLRGGIDFVDACHDALKLAGRDLVWWCGMIDNCHHHEDYSVDNILRTAKHFKKVSISFLNKQDYKSFKIWNSNWADLMIICNHLDPERWTSNSETINDPVRQQGLGYLSDME